MSENTNLTPMELEFIKALKIIRKVDILESCLQRENFIKDFWGEYFKFFEHGVCNQKFNPKVRIDKIK